MGLTDFLRCPKTTNKLRFNDADSVVQVEDSDITYPIIDGIIDFCPQAGDEISASYDKVASRYNGCLTNSNIFAKVTNLIVWGFVDDYDYADTVLSYLPFEFDGILLDVPVGTGVFTDSLYTRFPNATILGVDYSMGMLKLAKERFAKKGLSNICLVRADVANLPLPNATADIVLSMNGLHVFPNKQQATAEMRRVIKNDGLLVACGYAKGDRWLSDWFVKHFGIRRGYFRPPFFTVNNIDKQFEGFKITRKGKVKSGVYFEAVRG